MVATTLKSLRAHWRRFMLTAAAVIIGIAFATGALVLTDTSARVFDDQFAQSTAGVDLIIRTRVAFGAAMGVEVERDPLDAALIDRVAPVDGVQDAVGRITGQALLIVDGEPVVTRGPSIAMSWHAEPFTAFQLRSGRAPQDGDEIVVDAATAADRSIGLGDEIAVQVRDGQHPMTVVGIAGFGDADGIPGATVTMLHLAAAQQLLDLEGQVTEIAVVIDGPVNPVREQLAAELGADVDIVTAQDTAAASADAAKAQLSYIKAMLLVLAATALIVGAFLIANTYAIVIAQRTRELAMLRAIGATGRQIRRSVLLEAAVVGVLASTIGTASGVGTAAALRRLLAGMGADLPGGALVVQPRTIAIGVGVGITITLLSARAAARRASQVPPVAAMRDALLPSHPTTRRMRMGVFVLAVGTAGLVASASADALPLVGLSILGVLCGVAMTAPGVVPRVVDIVGRPFARSGIPGRLARDSARSSPRRTAATASALAVGIAVVTLMTVVATSVKASMADGYAEVITADVVVESARGEMLGGLSPTVAHHIGELPEVAIASALRYGHWLDQGQTAALTAVDPATITQVADLEVLDGDMADLADGGVMLAESEAEAHDVGVGDHLAMTLPRTGDVTLPVVGTFPDEDAAAMATGILISLDTYAEHFREDVDAAVLIQLSPGVATDEGVTLITEAIQDFPTAAVRDEAQAQAARSAGIDGVLALVSVLLLLAVVIALLGIANALGLSIVERTREVGLLRAVGMDRRHVARMVRLEALLIAIIGGSLGVALGTAFGWALVNAMSVDGTLTTVIPGGRLAAFLLIAAIGGGVAGVLPARRASRMDVLTAVAAH